MNPIIKKVILTCTALLFIACGFFILSHDNVYDETTANYKNIKKSINHLLAQLKGTHDNSQLNYSTSITDELLLLLSDTNDNLTYVQAWKNIALEEGLHLVTMSDSNFLDLNINNFQGIILADATHKDIAPELSKKLINYVASGGSLMLVYDAATLTPNNSVSKRYPLVSELLGINCDKKNLVKGCRSEISPVGSSIKNLSQLGVPPGKCIPSENETDNNLKTNEFCAISSMEFGVLGYTHYVINNTDDSPPLLTTADNQLIATVKSFGKGRVLYINLPLTYLWAQTDSMFLHLFLRFFASDMLHLPVLATVPNGIGGLVMNLHVESIDALAGFNILENLGLFKQGPYSIDFTAGPGVTNEHDHLGMDVLKNKRTQSWIRYLASLGNTIGSDGGWLHDYYGLHANESNQAEFEKYIRLNNEAMESILGQKVLEFVPSMGNQPSWATRYLESQGFLGYYSTANTGVGPTQHYINGIFDKESLWSFPVLPYKKGASFRDFGRIGYSEPEVTQWLIDSTNFVSLRNTSRLVYFHPTDILFFPQYSYSLKSWLSLTQKLHKKGEFQWYSMVELAKFLNKRRQVIWSVTNQRNMQFIKAEHADGLKNQSWILSKKLCDKPKITLGTAIIKENQNEWIVQAGEVKKLEFNCHNSTK